MQSHEKEIDLKRLWVVLKKQFIWILLIAIIGAVGAGVYTKLTTKITYTTESTFLVSKQSTEGSTNSSTTEYYEGLGAERDAPAIAYILTTNDAISYMLKEGNYTAGEDPTDAQIVEMRSRISAQVIEGTRFISVRVTNAKASDALEMAQVIEMHFPNYIDKNMPSLNASVSRADAARAPGGADGVPVKRNAALGGVAAFVLAYLAFFIFDMLDNSVHSESTLATRFPEIPVLGHIPLWRSKKLNRRQAKLEMKGKLRDYDEKVLSETTPAAIIESYRGLRTNVSYIASGKTSVIGITSVKSGECKSVVSANLAVSYAALKKKVLLVEGDMRLPSLHEIFHVEPMAGLPEILAGIESDYKKCLFHINEHMDLLPVGHVPPNPAELLAGEATKPLFDALRGEYDLIILDLPPIGTVSDAGIASSVVDEYLLSARVEGSNCKAIEGALRDMSRLNMKVSGFVLSGIKNRSSYAAEAYYNYTSDKGLAVKDD